jgi:hypothetical protein
MSSALRFPRFANSLLRIKQISDNLTGLQAFVLIATLSFMIRVTVVVILNLQSENTEAINVAISLARDGTFSNPYPAATGPTAHVAPVYPFLLSRLYIAFHSGFDLARSVLSSALVSIHYALLPLAAGALGMPRFTGFAAGLVAALLPIRMWVETSGGHETALSAVLAVLLIPITSSLQWVKIPKWKQVLLGVAWGFAFLVNPVFMLVLTGVLLVLALKYRVWLAPAVTLFCAGLVTLPWIGRNYKTFGELLPIRDNIGLELAVSNNDTATPLMERNVASPTFRHPLKDTEEARKMQAMGELRYYQSREREATSWIATHWRHFASLTGQRLIFFWFSPVSTVWKNVFLAVLTVGGFVGWYFLWQRQRSSAAAVLILWITYQMPYWLVQVSPRYRYPIDWTFWILTAYATSYVITKGRFVHD